MNDLENLYYGLIIFWGSTFAASYDKFGYLLMAFVACRVAHTVSYLYAL